MRFGCAAFTPDLMFPSYAAAAPDLGCGRFFWYEGQSPVRSAVMTQPLHSSVTISILLAVMIVLQSCATPVMPTGGPVDTTPPELVDADPADGAVHVDTDRVTLAFSKPIDATAAQRSIVITPAFDGRAQVNVRGRVVEVVFPEPLRPNRTYVISFGTQFRDTRNVALRAPVTIAFATGDRVDQGSISGTLRSPTTGSGVADFSVFAYELASADSPPPDPRTTAPDYRTDTGSDGTFRLDYLREGHYFVMALDDRNRNRRADPGEAFAPPPVPAIQTRVMTRPTAVDQSEAAADFDAVDFEAVDLAIDTTAVPQPDSEDGMVEADIITAPDTSAVSDTLAAPVERARRPVALDLFRTRADTLAPVVRSVRAIAADAYDVRFSKAIAVIDLDAWQTTAEATARPVRGAVVSTTNAEIVQIRTAPLSGERATFVLNTGAVRDSAGVAIADTSIVITPGAAAAIERQRFLGFAGLAADTVALRMGAAPLVRFDIPLDSVMVSERIQVVDAEERSLPASFTRPDTGIVRITVPASIPAGGRFQVRVREPDTTHVQYFRAPDPATAGEIAGTVPSFDGRERVVVEAIATEQPDRPRFTALVSNGRFEIRGLPAGSYRLRAFVDEDENGTWSGGRLFPYLAPEPLILHPQPVRVRARWETEVVLGTAGAAVE
ncbi:hypothetical protein BH23BAC4_BH23BAC4_06630 [soil metagenome]